MLLERARSRRGKIQIRVRHPKPLRTHQKDWAAGCLWHLERALSKGSAAASERRQLAERWRDRPRGGARAKTRRLSDSYLGSEQYDHAPFVSLLGKPCARPGGFGQQTWSLFSDIIKNRKSLLKRTPFTVAGPDFETTMDHSSTGL